MRKWTIRSGLRLLLAALLLIIIASFFHDRVAGLLSLSPQAESRFYSLGIFWAAAMGGYGVVMSALGFVLSPDPRDGRVRLLPLFSMILIVMGIFFYLFIASFFQPAEEQRLMPGSTITI